MNKDLSKYNWITLDGKTVRPVAEDIEQWPDYNKTGKPQVRGFIKDLVFACEGLQVNKVYKYDELSFQHEVIGCHLYNVDKAVYDRMDPKYRQITVRLKDQVK